MKRRDLHRRQRSTRSTERSVVGVTGEDEGRRRGSRSVGVWEDEGRGRGGRGEGGGWLAGLVERGGVEVVVAGGGLLGDGRDDRRGGGGGRVG